MSVPEIEINADREIREKQNEKRVIQHVRDAAERLKVYISNSESLTGRREGDYLSVPVHVTNPGWDAVQKAKALQQIEDEWNYPEGTEERPALMLLLVPTAN